MSIARAYRPLPELLFTGALDFTTITLRLMLLDDTYLLDLDHEHLDEVTGEISGAGYTAGGALLDSVGLNLDDWDEGTLVVTCTSPVSWPAATFTTHQGLLYLDTGDSSTSLVLVHIDFEGPLVADDEDFDLDFDGGLLRCFLWPDLAPPPLAPVVVPLLLADTLGYVWQLTADVSGTLVTVPSTEEAPPEPVVLLGDQNYDLTVDTDGSLVTTLHVPTGDFAGWRVYAPLLLPTEDARWTYRVDADYDGVLSTTVYS